MTSPLTVTFSGSSSILQVNFLPEIILSEKCDYSCALLDLIITSKNSDELKKIIDLGVIHIDCDIISGSYINGVRKHIIHQFSTSASHVKGQILVEIPKNLNYFPIKTRNLHSIQISIVDCKGKVISINDADINCRINIKRSNCENTS